MYDLQFSSPFSIILKTKLHTLLSADVNNLMQNEGHYSKITKEKYKLQEEPPLKYNFG
jgi:hypothetical protein